MVEAMDLAHDGENKINDSLEIRTPHDVFCIRFFPELEKWLEELDGKSGNSREMLTLFGRIKDFCKQVRSSKNYLLKRMHNDQWLHSKITLQNHQAIHVAVAPKLQGEVLEQLPADGDSEGVMGSPYPSWMAGIDMTVQSNILPRQASLEKLRSVATSQYAKYLSLSWLLADAGVAGTRGLGSLVYKVATEWKNKGMCELIKQLSSPSLENISHVESLPNIPPQTVTCDKVLANGLTADVWKVTISQGIFVKKAFKSLNDYRSLISMETQIVQKLCHPHIVHTFGCMGSNDPMSTEFSLLMECMQHDLSSRLTINPPLEPLDLLDVLLQVAEAMEYLQRLNVIHGDLKTQNILFSQFDISNDGWPFIVVKVADFGSAQALANSNRASFKPSHGTTKCAAPEVLRSRRTENLPMTEKDTYLEDPLKVDVYSFGITAFEVLTGLVPFDGKTRGDLVRKIKDHDKKLAQDFSKTFTDATENYPEFFISFMQRCWAYDPKERPYFHEIIGKIVEAKKCLMNPRISEPLDCHDLDMQEVQKDLMIPEISEPLDCHDLDMQEVQIDLMNPEISEPRYCRDLAKNPSVKKLGIRDKGRKIVKKVGKVFWQVKRKCFGIKKRATSMSTANQVCPHPPESISSPGTLVKSSSLKAKTPKRKREGKTLKDGLQPQVEGNKKSKS